MAFTTNYPVGGTVDTVKKVLEIDHIGSLGDIGSIDSIKGFAQNTQPYNKMMLINVGVGQDVAGGTMILPNQDVEILAFSVTCSGYGEDDRYDIYVNGQIIFDNWYCAEVREGMYLGTSAWVFTVPPLSKVDLVFHNASTTSKKLWFGVRTIVNPVKEEEKEEEVL